MCTKVPIPIYTILDVSDYEVTWKEKDLVSKIPPVGHPSLTEENIKNIAISLLYTNFRGSNVKSPLEFVNMVREIRDTSSKFHLTTIDKCNRDIIIDEDRSKLTCSNLKYKLCPY